MTVEHLEPASDEARPARTARSAQATPMGGGVALVLGASRGLGLIIARELLRRGYTTVVAARQASSLDRARQIVAADGELHTAVCDVADHEAVEALVDRVEREHGPVEVLVHVAGVIQVGPLDSLSRQHFEEAIDIMLWGPIHASLAVVDRMRSRGHGRIGVITSIGGKVSVPHLLPYSTAKFGAVGFTEGLGAELAGTGVSATTVIPGLMRTGSHLQAMVTGDQGAEFAWFAPGASLPVISMDAERAARRIVDGILRGDSHVTLTPLAIVGMRVQGMAPSATSALMGVMSRLLPTSGSPASAPPSPETVPGHQARDILQRSRPGVARVVRGLTVLGDRAASRFNEHPR